jgi:hypothetical protein
MRGRSHDHDFDPDAFRPKGDRLESTEETDALGRAAAAGRLDVLGPAGLLGLQRSIGNAGTTALVEEERSPVLDVIGSGGGSALGQDTRAEMESRFGTDFGDVRLHTGDTAQASAASVNAQAYTVGSDIVFADGQYDPGTPRGQHMLAHELTHVVQQRSGPVDGSDAGGGVKVSDPGDRFEREASANADRLMSTPATAQRTADPLEEEEYDETAQTYVQRQEDPEEDLEDLA